MMYLVTGHNIPNQIYKGENKEEVKKKFEVGLKNPERFNPKIRPLTLEELDSITPDEFCIIADTSF